MSDKTKKKEEEKKKDDKKKEKKDKKEEEDDDDDDDDDDDEDISDDSHEEGSGSGSGSEKHSKGGFGHRLKKNIAGKVMTSSLGKKIIPPQLRGLLKGLKRIIARVMNQKTANQVEKNMIRLIVKAKLAIDAKKVKEDEFMAADAPLRKAFDVIVDMYDYYGDELNDRMKAKFEAAAKYMAEVGNITRTVLSAHIQPHTVARLKMVFDTLCNSDFLVKVWQNPNTGKDLEDLIDAMHKYTQFH